MFDAKQNNNIFSFSWCPPDFALVQTRPVPILLERSERGMGATCSNALPFHPPRDDDDDDGIAPDGDGWSFTGDGWPQSEAVWLTLSPVGHRPLSLSTCNPSDGTTLAFDVWRGECGNQSRIARVFSSRRCQPPLLLEGVGGFSRL